MSKCRNVYMKWMDVEHFYCTLVACRRLHESARQTQTSNRMFNSCISSSMPEIRLEKEKQHNNAIVVVASKSWCRYALELERVFSVGWRRLQSEIKAQTTSFTIST